MAYTHSKYEVEIVPALGATSIAGVTVINGLSLAVTSIAGVWAPGFVPHIIKGAALIRVGAQANDPFTGDPVSVIFSADISTPGTATKMFQINLPSSAHGFKSIYYRADRYIEIKPGMTVEVHAATAATAGVYAKAVLYVEPRWEEPGNVTTMQLTT